MQRHSGARSCANPESTTTGENGTESIGVMDSGLAGKSPLPGMTELTFVECAAHIELAPCNDSGGCLPIPSSTRLIIGGTLMRAQFLAFTFLATVVASSALAQQAASPPAKTFMNNKEIRGRVDKAKAARRGAPPRVAEPILSLAPYPSQLQYPPATPPQASH